MKESIKLICITAILFLSGSDLFSTPLNGSYSIGSGGNYPTIHSAINEASTQGINGPVVFNILSGVYNEQVTIGTISGSSEINTLTLKSTTGNPEDVRINGLTYALHVFSDNIFFEGITFGSTTSNIISLYADNINLINNDFSNENIIGGGNDINITGNRNIGNFHLEADELYNYYNLNITGNSFNGHIDLDYYVSVLISENQIGEGLETVYCYDVTIDKNKLNGYLYIDNQIGDITNNFFNDVSGEIYARYVINNTFVGNSVNSPVIRSYYCRTFINNIIINTAGGPGIKSNMGASDYNNYYNGGNDSLIISGEVAYNSVSDFFTATGLDEHSKSQPVTFQSSSDLHLAGSSIGDELLAGIPNALVPDDIDGQPRSPLHPYIGADEVIDFPLPVELSSFTSSVNGNNVSLIWTISSETNNSGFDIERAIDNGQLTIDNWIMIGHVKGSGTINEPREYTFTDRNLASGKYKYRLKQIDYNGNFEYYNLTEEVFIGVPENFELSQNYPNPFNPTTNLEFGIPELGFVTLKVYDISGKEVATLVNEIKSPGRYNVKFDGSNFASGVYFYKITSGNFSAVKRMFLIK
ncbi:MAG: T9SS type A sorting domain-containing protein [Ignavibacteriae bacterium]|nr:T9SS type A sorting domain-containing protein [Ignavibacteriota bacterium]